MDNRFQLSSEGSNAIALIRMIACFSIVACHFLQAYGSGWAYVFNVGVQIFFMMSGFLYGVFGIKSVRKFYTKRFKKIYWPYLLWTCIIGALLLLVNRDIVTIKLFIAQVFMYYTLPGQEHLWFMFVLFICYIIVPIFEIIKNPKLSLIVLSACILIFTTCFIYTEKADYLWYAIYFIGYGIGRYKYLAYSFGLLATMSFMYATSITRSLSAYRGGVIAPILHVSLAIIICSCLYIVIIKFLRWIRCSRLPKEVGKFEFEMYLVHQTFIFGPFAIISLLPSTPLNIIITLLAIIATTIIFILIKNFLTSHITRIISELNTFKQ